MNLISNEYISINWMRQKLIDLMYDGVIDHEALDIFLKLIADWKKENDQSA